MALQTFTWSPRNGPVGDFKYRTSSVQYGDGYEGVTGNGINPETQSWPLTFTGMYEDMKPVLNFLREHGEMKAFKWTNPLGEIGLYRALQMKVTALDFARMTITATFATAYRAEPM